MDLLIGRVTIRAMMKTIMKNVIGMEEIAVVIMSTVTTVMFVNALIPILINLQE